jgi:hypothetical protein
VFWHAGFETLPTDIQSRILDMAVESGTAYGLRGVCRRFQAHALLHASAQTTLTIDRSKPYDMLHARRITGLQAIGARTAFVCAVLGSSPCNHLVHLRALSLIAHTEELQHAWPCSSASTHQAGRELPPLG